MEPDAWDDSELIQAWDDALNQYRDHHGRDYKAGDESEADFTGSEEGDEEYYDEDGEYEEQGGAGDDSYAAEPTGEDNTQKATESTKLAASTVRSPPQVPPSTNPTPPAPPPPFIPAGGAWAGPTHSSAPVPPNLSSIPDDQGELSNLLMSWYYAGYYTGYYQGRRQR
ncbi:hypothetical protein IWQ60_000447 [Tieghemiomyces parasiticus]|uniref:Survival Motor Neuron Gemin2-binding domain-containing protein n=1 Tax=Tieghemiomyces parasiticus TaxID=78921 RepID=A0A9W8AMN9_9FUNG|nr:hypothetical protein IWQ60_000447 [Tieghemiomyces parasiticus]